ncbi:MAG: histidine kinase dimerization/phospho-acceptor domain-containing protein, partial [bacterium]
MTPFVLLNTVFVVAINITSVFLGTWVYLANRKKKTNQTFFILALFLILWVSSAYLCNFLTKDYIALFWAKIGYGAGTLFLLFIYLFFNYFPREEKQLPILSKLAIIICLFLFFFSTFTNFVVKSVKITSWGTLPVLGDGQVIFLGLILVLGLLVVFQFLAKYLGLTKEEKFKAQYLLVGLLIFIIMNLFFNIGLPFWQKTPQYYQFGNYSAIFFLGFTAFAIVKRELFGMKVVLTALLVGLTAILLFSDILIFTELLWLRIFKILILAAFLGLGYSLIRSVTKEIKQREELEKLTWDLEKANVELTRLDKTKSEFISIASHQLRTPLTSIKGYISMILEKSYGQPPEKMARPLENIYTSNERLIK